MAGNTVTKRRPRCGDSPDSPVRVFVAGASPASGERAQAAVRGVLGILRSLGVEILMVPDGASVSARLGMLNSADAMLIVRTGPSESAAFETAYNVFGGPRVPMFFALWKHIPAPAAILRELEQVGPAESATFARAEDLRACLAAFLGRAAEESRKRERRMIRMMERLVA